MSVIDNIRNAAQCAGPGPLDQEVYLGRDIHLYKYRDPNVHKMGFVDVPLKAIVALGHDNFWGKGDTWRLIVNKLTGNGWTEDVLNYFESELLEHSFPAPASRYELRLNCIGGACECANGNHRLAAAKAWLIFKYGPEATLKKAKISYHPIHRELLPILQYAKSENSDLLISSVNYMERNDLTVKSKTVKFFAAVRKDPRRIYAWLEDELVELHEPKNLLQHLFSCFVESWIERREWDVIPLLVLETLLDNDWIEKQFVSQ